MGIVGQSEIERLKNKEMCKICLCLCLFIVTPVDQEYETTSKAVAGPCFEVCNTQVKC